MPPAIGAAPPLTSPTRSALRTRPSTGRYDVTGSAGVVRSSKYPQLDDREWIEQRYVEHGMTQAQIAAEIGYLRSAVALAMDRLGIQARPNKTPEYPELHDRQWLADQFAAGGTASSIARLLGCHHTSVAVALGSTGCGRSGAAGVRAATGPIRRSVDSDDEGSCRSGRPRFRTGALAPPRT